MPKEEKLTTAIALAERVGHNNAQDAGAECIGCLWLLALSCHCIPASRAGQGAAPLNRLWLFGIFFMQFLSLLTKPLVPIISSFITSIFFASRV